MTRRNKNNNIFTDRLVLKIILNFWSFLTMAFFVIDFFSGHQFDGSTSAIGIIYLAMLGIYTSEKEYTRWKSKFKSRFIGEGFVIMWTIVMTMFVIIAPLSNGIYIVPEGFALIYTAVICVFAVSHHSKRIHRRK